MKKIKIFPKMFIQIFSVLGIIIILVHSLVFFIFPKTYLETRKEKIYNIANEISSNMNGKEIKYIEQTLELYSKSSEIKAFIKEENNKNEIQIKDNINVNLESDSNSLIIEEREIKLNDGKKINLQFVSTADMQKDAKDLSIKFLPYSLFISILFSAIISLIYAKSIKNNLQEIKIVTDKMMKLDKKTRLKVSSNDEVGELKQQINDLYSTLLRTIDNLEFKNKEILKLEKLKYDFFKGASHELKTPLASLKIILENMKYNIGKYKERDIYINECIEIVDSLTKNISQILSVHSIENLNNDEEYLKINDTLEDILKKYEILANQQGIDLQSYSSYVTTPRGSKVSVTISSSSDSDAALASNAYFVDYIHTYYPGASIVAAASDWYNCHGFAWAQSTFVWMNDPSAYWNDGSYSLKAQGQPTAVGQKVTYGGTTHSGIVIGLSGNCIRSKWGRMNLVDHSVTNCPYYYAPVIVSYYN